MKCLLLFDEMLFGKYTEKAHTRRPGSTRRGVTRLAQSLISPSAQLTLARLTTKSIVIKQIHSETDTFSLSGLPMTTKAFTHSVTTFAAALLTLSACSTTEQEVAEQIEILAASEIDSEPFNQSVAELVQIGRPAARQLMALLDPALYLEKQYREYRDEIEKTRTGAAIALGRIRHQAATASLVARITTVFTTRERIAALRAVSELGFDLAAIKALEKLQIDPDPLIRLYANMALIKMGEAGTQERVREVVLGEDAKLAGIAMSELEKANHYGVPLLVDLSRVEGSHQEVTRSALVALSDQLVIQLGDDDPEVRQSSAKALGLMGNPEVGDALSALLDDKSNTVRFNAASALSRLGDSRGIDFLFNSIRTDDAVLRVNAIKSLVSVQLASGVVEARLLEAMASKNPMDRSGAAQILGEAGVSSAVVALMSATSDDDPRVRWTSIMALGQIGASEARPQLETLVEDGDATVAYYAEWALGRI